MIKILLVDDHQMFMDGVRFLLAKNEQIEVVGDAISGEKAFKILKEKEVDLVILDVRMPVLDGEAVLKIIKKDYPKIKVLVVSMSAEAKDVKRMMFNGANGYLLKENTMGQLVYAIHQVMGGQLYLPLS